MGERRVVNASPLIFLGAAGLLDLLRIVDADVIVTDAVFEEVSAKGAADRAARTLAAASWIGRVRTPSSPESVLAWDLGPGESSVISCALGPERATAVLDDLAARRCARSLGVPVRGTLGLVLRGHQSGLVADPRATLEELRHRGMWLSDAVLDQALRAAGIDG